MHGVSIKNWKLTPGFEFLGVKRNAMPRTYKPDPRGKICLFGHALESMEFQ